jgi:hypothetical protein
VPAELWRAARTPLTEATEKKRTTRVTLLPPGPFVAQQKGVSGRADAGNRWDAPADPRSSAADRADSRRACRAMLGAGTARSREKASTSAALSD